jgi:pyruvate,water dikinase
MVHWVERWMPANSGDQAGSVLKGVGASSGRVTATARVVLGPQDFARLQPGEVLVTAITTPAWTPLFARAGAVVTDIGGPLSHSSIVAREYGIPAVLGTGAGSLRVRDGQRVTVDGDAGTVTLLDVTGRPQAAPGDALVDGERVDAVRGDGEGVDGQGVDGTAGAARASAARRIGPRRRRVLAAGAVAAAAVGYWLSRRRPGSGG